VLLMPARLAPHKPGGEDAGCEHRLRMCRLLAEGEAGLSVSTLELEREGPSYTVDTLRAIHARDPRVEVTFVVGADIARTLPSWREPGAVTALAGLAVAARRGFDREQVTRALAEIPAARTAGEARRTPSGVRFLELPEIDISSSMVRERLSRGEAVQGLVGEAVARYIAEQGLYTSAGEPVG
jgi:nicotinate-nucleotide adenylyltransferase